MSLFTSSNGDEMEEEQLGERTKAWAGKEALADVWENGSNKAEARAERLQRGLSNRLGMMPMTTEQLENGRAQSERP